MGQAEACSLALARAFYKWDPNLADRLNKEELLKGNTKIVERKKTGLYKARKKYPYKRR